MCSLLMEPKHTKSLLSNNNSKDGNSCLIVGLNLIII